MQKLLHLCNKYHLCDDGNLHCPKLSYRMTILICEYCGVNLDAAKYFKSLLKKFLPHHPFKPTIESPSKYHCCSSPAFSIEIINASSKNVELVVMNSSTSVFPLCKLCVSFSTVQAEVGNIHISIANLIPCLASELKDLHATCYKCRQTRC